MSSKAILARMLSSNKLAGSESASPTTASKAVQMLKRETAVGIPMGHAGRRRNSSTASHAHAAMLADRCSIVETQPSRRVLITLKATQFVIMPESNGKLVWDIIMTLMVIYYALVVPVTMVFEGAMDGPEFAMIEHVNNGLFVLDIFLNFMTAFKKNGVIVRQRSAIAREYCRTWLCIDIVACFPIDAVLSDNSSGGQVNKLARLLRIFKLLRVVKIRKMFRRIEDYTKLNPGMVRLFKVFIFMVLVWHWIACGYWGVASVTEPASEFEAEAAAAAVTVAATTTGAGVSTGISRHSGAMPWGPVASVYANTPHAQYCFAFFWAVTVTTGIGHDVVPRTPLQTYFTTMCIAIGVAMNAFLIGSAGSALSSLDTTKTQQRVRMEAVNGFMRHRKVGRLSRIIVVE
jgi:hypothetical protein